MRRGHLYIRVNPNNYFAFPPRSYYLLLGTVEPLVEAQFLADHEKN